MTETRFEFLAAFECEDTVADRFRVVFLPVPTPEEYEEIDLLAFTMSDNADAPNGVCMTTTYASSDGYPGETERAREVLPKGTQHAIRNIEAERYTEDGELIAGKRRS